MRKTFIFGNGLGMSIAPEAFNLHAAMSKVWDDGSLGGDQKQLIVACLPKNTEQPSSEDQLGTLQETVSACDVLLGVRETAEGHWLSPQGQKFPNAVRWFIFQVARHMYTAKHGVGESTGERCKLPDDFVEELARVVRESQSHVATLNYDGLLSAALERQGLLAEGSTALRDGFLDSKFDRTNLFRKKNIGGWYLHLHGCPLFVDRDKSKPAKITESTLLSNSKGLKNVGRHIVLTHFRHKPQVIDLSDILRTYWEFLARAIEESVEVLLFGYSGNDEHLNRLIAQIRGAKRVRVIEWLGAGHRDMRRGFWAQQLGGDVELLLLEDVLGFSDW